jgi:predicted nucleic acid-binding protein
VLDVGVALDSTLFIDLARRRPSAIAKVDELDGRHEVKVIPTPVAFEILSGIVQTRSRTQASLFKGWVGRFHVAPLDLAAAEGAATIRAEFAHLGRAKESVDVLAAGIALSGGHSLVTRDRDFREIGEATGLVIEPY